jgi:DNA processing protein
MTYPGSVTLRTASSEGTFHQPGRAQADYPTSTQSVVGHDVKASRRVGNHPEWVAPETLLGALTELEQKYAPPKLYVAGPMEIPLPHPRVAIIGTRQPSAEGRVIAWNLASALARAGAVVVSGLARGIDTVAHTAAIEAGGRTIAVLGTPLSKTYPPENAQLQHQIMERHLVISQFPENYPPQGKNFVLRNRTMALIADASVIVESGEGGGSLHQGWEALRLGRPLFINAREFGKAGLEWPRKMADYGAVQFSDPRDVLDLVPSENLGLAVAALPPS